MKSPAVCIQGSKPDSSSIRLQIEDRGAFMVSVSENISTGHSRVTPISLQFWELPPEILLADEGTALITPGLRVESPYRPFT